MCTLPCHASLNWTCIILVCASCHVYACAFTMLFVSFRCYFLVPVMLRFVRIRSTTLVCLLHGLVLLPSGISGKMTVTLDLTTIIAMLVVLMLSLCRASYHLLSSLPLCHEQPLTFFHHSSHPLFGSVPALLSPSYSVASCRCSCRLFHVGTWISSISWDITISLI